MITIPQNVQDITPYKPGKPLAEIRRELGLSDIAKLGSNENTLGSSPKALAAMRQAMEELHWYPEPACLDIRDAFAAYNNVKRKNIIVGNGSEGVLSYIFKTFLRKGDELLTSEGTFIGVYVLTQVNDVDCARVPIKADYSFDLDAILAGITDRTKMIYLANPNNPTGTTFGKAEFEAFMAKVPKNILVVLDEAYFEYASALREDYPNGATYSNENLLTLRTFSKAYGLAGMRIGYGIGPAELIAPMMKVKLPFEPSIIAQAAGEAAISDTEFLEKTIENNRVGLDYFYTAFDELGLTYFKSYANFVMIDFGEAAEANRINEEMLKRGVVVRPIGAFGLPHCIRISVGTPAENATCVAALREVLG